MKTSQIICVQSVIVAWVHLISAPPARADNPTIPSLLAKGIREQLDKVPNQAIFDFSEALLLKPDKKTAAEIYGDRSGAYLNKSTFDRAMADAEEAIRLAPEYFRGYQARGKIFYVRGQLSKARRDFDKALRLNPSYAGIYVNRGNLLSKKGDEASAIRDYTTAIRLEPSYADPYVCRGASYFALGRNKEALDDYHLAILVDPRQSDTYVNRAFLYAKMGEWERAVSDYSEFIKRHPDHADIYLWRAEAYIATGEYQSADTDIQKAQDLAGDNGEWQNSISWMRATSPQPSIRDGKVAIATAMKACEITSWNEAAYIDTLAAAYAEAGQFEPAIAYEKMTLTMVPERSPDRLGEEERLALYRRHQPYRDLPQRSGIHR